MVVCLDRLGRSVRNNGRLFHFNVFQYWYIGKRFWGFRQWNRFAGRTLRLYHFGWHHLFCGLVVGVAKHFWKMTGLIWAELAATGHEPSFL